MHEIARRGPKAASPDFIQVRTIFGSPRRRSRARNSEPGSPDRRHRRRRARLRFTPGLPAEVCARAVIAADQARAAVHQRAARLLRAAEKKFFRPRRAAPPAIACQQSARHLISASKPGSDRIPAQSAPWRGEKRRDGQRRHKSVVAQYADCPLRQSRRQSCATRTCPCRR